MGNFFLGGAGAGAYLVAVSLSGFSTTPLLRAASLLGPLLVLAGFLSVAAEAGRPLRGPRVLRMLRTSWMSRELWAGGAFIGLAALDLIRPWVGWRVAAALAALLFALAQGWILRHCRGVAAWNVPLMPPLFLASALVSGAGVLAMVTPLVSHDAEWLVTVTMGLIVLSGLIWTLYLTWSGGDAFHRATATLREDSAILGIFVIGHLLPLVMLILGLRAPAFVPTVAFLTGVGILIGQLQGKAWLILRAGVLRPITMANLTLRTSNFR